MIVVKEPKSESDDKENPTEMSPGNIRGLVINRQSGGAKVAAPGGTRTIVITTVPQTNRPVVTAPLTVHSAYQIKRPGVTAIKEVKTEPKVIGCASPTSSSRSSVSPVSFGSKRPMYDWENTAPAPPRKRERLTHLSPDEKLYRRYSKIIHINKTTRNIKTVLLQKDEKSRSSANCSRP